MKNQQQPRSGGGWAAATAVLAACAATTLTACDLDKHIDPLKANSGSLLSTTVGEQLTESMFIGKWDLNGERTNVANGKRGIEYIPSDLYKDIMGKGWRFEPNGVLKTDETIGYAQGTWRIDGLDTLVIREKGQLVDLKFNASFRAGYLYLKLPDGSWMIFERDKYFGF